MKALVLVLALSAATVVGCAPPAMTPTGHCSFHRPRIDPDLICRLEAPAEVTAGSPIPIRVTLTNVSRATPLHLPRSVLPRRGEPGALLVVSPDPRFALPRTERVDRSRKPPPGADAYERIDPGASVSVTIDLKELQPHLAEPGIHRIGFGGYLPDIQRGLRPVPQPPSIGSHALVPCNQVVVTVRAS